MKKKSTETYKDKSVLNGVLSLALLGLFSKLVTFALNNVLLRYVSPTVFGVAGVKLELVVNTVGFLGKEVSRLVAYEKSDSKAKSKSFQETINVSYCSIGLSLVACFVVYFYYRYISPERVLLQGALQLYLVALVLESLSEPIFILRRNELDFSHRSLIEAVALFVKSAFTVGKFVLSDSLTEENQLLVFGVAQLLYSITISVGYVLSQGISSWPLPKPLSRGTWITPAKRQLFISFSEQSLLKFFLTEGDKLLLNSLVPTESSVLGVFAFVMNYGSLLARIMFQPIEEASRSFFAASANQLDKTVSYLSGIMRLYAILEIVLLSLGLNYAFAFIYLVGGEKWISANAQSCLRVFIFSLPILAFNGVLEGFLQTTANPSQLHKFSRYLVIAWVAFSLVGYVGLVVLDMGASAVVIANVINAFLRLIYCYRFTFSSLKRPKSLELSEIFGFSALYYVSAVISFLATLISRWHFEQELTQKALLLHISSGSVCALIQLFILFKSKAINELFLLKKSQNLHDD